VHALLGTGSIAAVLGAAWYAGIPAAREVFWMFIGIFMVMLMGLPRMPKISHELHAELQFHGEIDTDTKICKQQNRMLKREYRILPPYRTIQRGRALVIIHNGKETLIDTGELSKEEISVLRDTFTTKAPKEPGNP